MPDKPAQLTRAERDRLASRNPNSLPYFARLLPPDHPARGAVEAGGFHVIDAHVREFGRRQLLPQGAPSALAPVLFVSEDVAATIPAVATSSMLSICFFAARNEQLHDRGYVIFEDALRSNTLSDTQDHLLRYLQYFVAALQNETVLTEHVATSTMEHTEFCFIHNRLPADDPAIGTRGEGRLMTTPHSVSTGLRQQARDVYMSKLWVDLFLAAVAARTLGAVDARGTDIVQIPRTGSRLLVTTKNAERQRPHTDSPIP